MSIMKGEIMFSATVWVILALSVYMLPAMVAAGRHHRSGTAIAVLNVLLGWTLLGWVGALVWALTGPPGSPAGRPDVQTRCPECRELIIKGARRCKHCSADLTGRGAGVPGVSVAPGMRPCPDCLRLAPVADQYCPACGHNMAP